MDAVDLLQPHVAEGLTRESLANPDARRVEAAGDRGGVVVRITRAGAVPDAPDSRALIEVSGGGSFRLLLDDAFELVDIDDLPDSWAKTFAELVALADAFLDGRGTRQRTPIGRGRVRDDVVLELGEDSFLVEGPTRRARIG